MKVRDIVLEISNSLPGLMRTMIREQFDNTMLKTYEVQVETSPDEDPSPVAMVVFDHDERTVTFKIEG